MLRTRSWSLAAGPWALIPGLWQHGGKLLQRTLESTEQIPPTPVTDGAVFITDGQRSSAMGEPGDPAQNTHAAITKTELVGDRRAS